jgi:hypothetical protein
MQTTKTACEIRKSAQTTKELITKFDVVLPIMTAGKSAFLTLNIPSSTAVAAAVSIPNTTPNPARRYVFCRPWPKS